ncbi:hypothetical protein [Methanocella conradii]|uniref:hypothetical protein n=1 Tax=Methanocella conradii TaxID=1175444 RepID=UPI0024B3C0BC|nr:hypothetical protein [Methanocella conradii]MDI6896677.1 hypothetical protein [Methanocella conradii]
MNSIERQIYWYKYILYGIISFSLGGVLWGSIGVLYAGPYRWAVFGLIGGFIFGLVGGLFLDFLSLKRFRMAIYAAIGYAISGGAILFSLLMLIIVVPFLAVILLGIGIIAGGLFIGLALNRIKLFMILGALGYIIGTVFGVLLFKAVIIIFQSNITSMVEFFPP